MNCITLTKLVLYKILQYWIVLSNAWSISQLMIMHIFTGCLKKIGLIKRNINNKLKVFVKIGSNKSNLIQFLKEN